jgi:hypothetical protein
VTEAAQAAFTDKLQHYSKHHTFPHRVCYPLAFERSGYLHPVFEDFIDLYAVITLVVPLPLSHSHKRLFSFALLLRLQLPLLLPL